MGILDANFVEETNKDVEINQLKAQLESAQRNVEWWEHQAFSHDPHYYHPGQDTDKSRSEMVSEMYGILYGDTPICDCCDGSTGFFLEIDALYNIFKKHPHLIRFIRWLGGMYYKR